MIEDIEIVLPTYIHVQHITQLVSSQASLNKQWLVSQNNSGCHKKRTNFFFPSL